MVYGLKRIYLKFNFFSFWIYIYIYIFFLFYNNYI
nr:MAG TPA: hypothetical protein [Caudoviricetes sp.]